jgi:hypothetical protein
MRSYLKNIQQRKRVGEVAQVVGHLSSKCPQTSGLPKKKKKGGRNQKTPRLK